MYVQRDRRWAFKRLGSSKWTMGDSGCYVTSVANILADSGYPDTPGDVCDALNGNAGFTKDGEAIWAKIHEAYPQFSYERSGTYRLVQLRLLSEYHYEALLPDGSVEDPWTGSDRPPAGFKATGSYSLIAVVPAPKREDTETMGTLPLPEAVTASYGVPIKFFVRSTASVRWRSAPSLSGEVMATYPSGTEVECDGTVDGDSVNGNARWYRSEFHGWYSTAAYNQHL